MSEASVPEASPDDSRTPAASADASPGLRSSNGVTILVPAYNEVQGIGAVLERLGALELGGRPIEILVVDDGSTDGTAEVLDEAAGRIKNLRVVRRPSNRGYGAALKLGFGQANHDVVVITDADGTYPEDRIGDLIDLIDQGAEMVVGERAGEDVHIPLIRRPAKATLRMLASYLAGTRIPDLNSGLRAFRRELVLQYRPILPDGFSFTTTITLASLTNGHAVEYVTINYAHRAGSSKIKPIRDTLGFTSLIVRTVMYFNPLKVFYPVAGVVFLGLVASATYDVVVDKNLGDKTVLLFVALVQILSIGLLADLIEKRSRL